MVALYKSQSTAYAQQELDRDMLREARASGKRQGQRGDSSQSETDTEDDRDADQSQDGEEEHDVDDFFVDNALREELGLGTGLDLGLGSDKTEAAANRNDGTARTQHAILETGATGTPGPSLTDRGLPAAPYTERDAGLSPDGNDERTSSRAAAPGSAGRRRDGAARQGFDVFSSSASSEEDSDDESDTSEDDESASHGRGGDGEERSDNASELACARSRASAAVLMVDALDPAGAAQPATETDASATNARVDCSARDEAGGGQSTATMVEGSCSAVDSLMWDAATTSIGSGGGEPGERQQNEFRSRDGVSPEIRNNSKHTGHRSHEKSVSKRGSEFEEDKGSDEDDEDSESEPEMLGPAGRRRGRRKAGGNTGRAEPQRPVESNPSAPTEEKGARRRKRQALKAAKAAAQQGKGGQVKARGTRAGEPEGTDECRCRVCEMRFSSRTKLFAHVKKEGHALAT